MRHFVPHFTSYNLLFFPPNETLPMDILKPVIMTATLLSNTVVR